MPKLIVQEGYRQVSEVAVPEGQISVGRSTDNDLVLSRRGVSRHHLRLRCSGNTVHVEDLGSRNGTFLNSLPVTTETELKHMDVIQIGDTTCGKPYGFYAFDNCGISYFSIQFRGINE